MTEWFDIEIGLRQGCVLSPLLFLIFINDLLKELKASGLGITIGAMKVSNLTFADDIALLADNKANLQRLVKITESSFNAKKSKVVIFNGN